MRHFEWDAEHRLSRATILKSNGRFVHVEHWGYDYDPFGRRIAKYRLNPTKPERCRPWLDGGTTHFSWDGNRLLLERQGERQSLYVYEPDSFVPLALVRSEGDEEVADQDFPMPAEWLALKERHPADWDATAGALIHKIEAKRQARRERQGHIAAVQEESAQAPAEILHFHTDHLGTPRELTDASGHIVWSATYKAWGNTAKIEHPGRFVHQVVGNTQVERWQEQSDPVEQNLRFQGQYFDHETGLHYNRFRYYDPDIGRFVSQDPIGLLGGKNFYFYGFSPTNSIDPLGLMPWKWNPNGMGHHLVYKNKAKCAGLDLLATNKDTPTFFPIPYEEGMHEEVHRAQDPFVGGRTGGWAKSADELLIASKEGLGKVAHIKGDLKIPRTGKILAHNVTPAQAYEKLMEWLAEELAKKCG